MDQERFNLEFFFYIEILLSEKLLYKLCRGMHYGDSIKDIIWDFKNETAIQL